MYIALIRVNDVAIYLLHTVDRIVNNSVEISFCMHYPIGAAF